MAIMNAAGITSGIGVIIQSGVGVIISGQGINLIPPGIIRTMPMLLVTGASGGVVVGSGVTNAVIVKAFTINSGSIWVGGNSGANFPYSGNGLILISGESVAIDANNFNIISVFAEVSGDKITAIGN
jgi:hypothetical protein